jgi:hypothetical protein
LCGGRPTQQEEQQQPPDKPQASTYGSRHVTALSVPALCLGQD